MMIPQLPTVLSMPGNPYLAQSSLIKTVKQLRLTVCDKTKSGTEKLIGGFPPHILLSSSGSFAPKWAEN